MTNHVRPHAPRMAATSAKIGRELALIGKGPNRGSYPALDRLIPEWGVHPQPGVDVYPTVPERLAVVEHIAKDLDRQFEDHKIESIRAGAKYATKEEVAVVDKRIDREVLPTIDTLARNSALKTVGLIITVIVALISMAYNVINITKTLHL